MARRDSPRNGKVDGTAPTDDAATARRVQMSVQVSPELRQRLRLTAVFLERELSELPRRRSPITSGTSSASVGNRA